MIDPLESALNELIADPSKKHPTSRAYALTPWMHCGYVARLLTTQCCTCGTEVHELLGVYSSERRPFSRRLTRVLQWPRDQAWPTETETKQILHCAYCIEELGFNGPALLIEDPYDSLEGQPTQILLEETEVEAEEAEEAEAEEPPDSNTDLDTEPTGSPK